MLASITTLHELILICSPTVVQLHTWRPLLPFLKRFFPRKWLRYGAEVIPYAPLQRMRSISDSVNATARQILQQKKDMLRQADKATVQELGEGQDVISILSAFPSLHRTQWS